MAASIRPKLSLRQIFNMSFGFLGIQFGFALQNGNASRILQTYGADLDHLSWFWLAAPLTGMLVQPVIGYFSDRTWTSLGRRRPYFLAGAIVASIALIFMPNADLLTTILPPLYIGAGVLMLMDTSFNVSMEPFRALVADKLGADQRTLGFSVQTFLIGVGAVVGSWLPYIYANWLGIPATADPGKVPLNVVYSFYTGAIVFILTILWTVFTTSEFPPGETEDYKKTKSEGRKGMGTILHDIASMPKTMRQLGLVQFFSWFALFSMWVFTTPAIASHVYGLDIADHSSAKYNEAANWVGIIFGVYNGVSAVIALMLPFIAKRIGRKSTHALSLAIGGLSLISIYFISDPNILILPMVGVGIAWASILAMPYAILAGAIPERKMGIYMGIFNFFITLPQIVNGIIGGPIVKYIYHDQAIYALIMAGVFFIIGAFSMFFVEDRDEVAVS
jgi:maltose/moltooligosaccharide transporter